MLLSREELDRSAVLDPEIAEALKNMSVPAAEPDEAAPGRAAMEAYDKSQSAGPTPPGQTELYHEIPMRDGFMSSLKIHKPSDAPPGPLIVLVFGGGFVAGSNDQFTRAARVLVTLFAATVVCPNYRRAPEHKFPTMQHDVWDSMSWIASNATTPLLHAAPASAGFIMGGVSAGGALTAALSRQFQQSPLAHPLTGQWLCVAGALGPSNVPPEFATHHISLEQNATAPILNAASMARMRAIAHSPDSHPLRFAVCAASDPAAQPPTYFQVCGADPLRDDGLIYHEILARAGVDTKIDFYPGAPHAHMGAFLGTKAAARANVDMVCGIGWLLGGHRREVARGEVAALLGESEG